MSINIIDDKSCIDYVINSYMEHCIVTFQLGYKADRKEALYRLKALYLEIIKYCSTHNEHKCPIILETLETYKKQVELILKDKFILSKKIIDTQNIEECLIFFMNSFIDYLDKELEHLREAKK
ncbi:hypothetical protein [Brachyspira hyodysenteriae]|uniref:hypothetical protein n=1 Tax=Brachyspira hyodysenteriae TaxID=159 RepID=UPI00063DC56B|nr:hypothetical protein [Brachyspira hyodysenteriae]KLI46113.1 hypothetical protein SZ41_12145 [Brachyspira hyodysenteriae]KLI53646.1 hypothetical protein SZ42_00720 [Brachyspira hyodysenteriae]MCZ9888965.1 hypothetical protein [Brachyspira hyodysenteriae]HJH54800.1 hypothetical protein [Brachyspira hyodysenteriae]